MARLALSPEDYTVAWICALPIELAAAQNMLDEEYNGVPTAPSDHNSYILGRVNDHNVVIANLPLGTFGITAAASVLVQMQATFPFLKYGLLVGIGGGVPTNVDIRLGDVVISMPTERGSGVIQYDFGKKTHAGLQPTGNLNKPSEKLLKAASHLRKDHILGKRSIMQIIYSALEKNKGTRNEFSRPTDDFLFSATYQHQDGAYDCSTCDRTQIVTRAPQVTDEPGFHYGLIASANQVMKDAQTRDQVAKARNILCFEMEAAGLMDLLPFVVIRGISDYSDSHKQKEWQGYAALTAAAYAKQLLSVVLRTQRMPFSSQVMHTLTSPTGKEFTPEEEACLRSLFITEPEENKNALKRKKGKRAPGTCDWIMHTDELRAWLAPPSASSERLMWFYGYPGTGKSTMAITLVEKLSEEYDTISQEMALAYFFCDSNYPERCTATAILRGLLSQLLKQRPRLMKHLLPKFKERGGKLFNSFDALWAIFIEIGHDNTYHQLYCIIDALDECDQISQRMLLMQITQSCENQNDNTIGKIHFLIISRPFPEIREYLDPYRSKDLGTYQQVQDDLQVFIEQKVNDLALRKCYTARTKRDVSRILKEKAEGTFLWVAFACEKLEGIDSREAIKKLHSLPQGLHSLYAKLLEMALDADEDILDPLSRILAVVATSRRPLSVLELSIACKFYEEEDNEHRKKYTEEYVHRCCLMVFIQDGLVRLLHKSVRDFLLISTHPFSINELQVHASLANRCVEYMLDNIGHLHEQVDQQRDSFLEYATLYWPEHASSADVEFKILPKYQVFFCPISAEREVWLKAYRKHRPLPQRFSILHVAATWGIGCLIPFSLSKVSAVFGLVTGLLRLSKTPYKLPPHVDTVDQSGKTPLHWAVIESQKEAVNLLLHWGANHELLDNQSRSALHFAAEVGNEEFVRQFAHTQTNLEVKDVYGQSALLIAVENLHAAAVHRLAEATADVHTSNNMHQNTLHLICKARQSDSSYALLSYFLNQGVSAHELDVQNMTPFLYAVACGRQDLALLLLQNGYDINHAIHRRSWTGQMQNGYVTYKLDESPEDPSDRASAPGMTALHFSALNGNIEMTNFLCLQDANLHSQSETGDTPLHLAIRRTILGSRYDDHWITGDYSIEDLQSFITDWEREAVEIINQIDTTRVRIVGVLLGSGSVNINIANNQGDCPHHVIPFDKWYASDILMKLIKKGADLSKSNNRGQTCLHLACGAGHLDAVRILTSRNCSITLQDKYGLSPLHYAVGEGQTEVVRDLLELHRQQSRENSQHSDLLQMKLLHHHAKSDFGSIELINLLSESGFDLNLLDDNGESVLSLYLGSFHLLFRVDVFDCLVDNGADVTWLSEQKESLIHRVMHQWDSDNALVLERLLRSLDIRAKDAKDRNALHHGAIHGAFNENLTSFLRERDIVHLLHENDFQGKKPLDYAEEEARRERHPDLFKGSRWHESLHNLKTLEEGQVFTHHQRYN
ncbi:uncharacterized protein BHQ10_010339 [Talaromyces amestolkiae]|uniref:Uncharacterized protein n=1 Tax=Talaromyces amestolkiae TaxID=1196081 RepID=A0A364LEV6_TALAM|nr:uncharacterized protein BHQ10_010339 [Talaromyces amestolkiae]RAO74327.1 hypothetical protein BHQ10_010339 [Talaromyces amestolkiae]